MTKSRSDYSQAAQTILLDETGTFFAFSQEQYDKAAVEGVTYVSCGGGMITPKDNAKALAEGLKAIHHKAIQQDMLENSIKDIIWRELANYEIQFTGDYDNIIEVLEDYPITKEQIMAQEHPYWEYCVENDLF